MNATTEKIIKSSGGIYALSNDATLIGVHDRLSELSERLLALLVTCTGDSGTAMREDSTDSTMDMYMRICHALAHEIKELASIAPDLTEKA